MRLLIYASLLLSFVLEVSAIWPQPKAYTNGSSVLWIQSDVKVVYNGKDVCGRSSLFTNLAEEVFDAQSATMFTTGDGYATSDETIVRQAINRTLTTLFNQSFVPWKLVARNQISKFEPPAKAARTLLTSITITQTGQDTRNDFRPLAGQVDESYNLTVGTDGTANIAAVSANGVMHALETFIQLFYEHSTESGIYTNKVPIFIIDEPKFPHRGLNLDVSRNYYPPSAILRTIDALSMNKFNRIHIHMTDSQSWPMDIPSIPELSQQGAYQTGLSYTPSDIQQIQQYALERGVEVIIEFDMPGHTTSIGLSHPELIAAFNAVPWDTYCAEPPCGSLQLNNPAVGTFLEKLFDDVLPRVQPYSAYFHSGGDEVNANTYLLDPTVKSNDSAVLAPLLQKFVDRNHDQIRKAGLAPIVWEEMLLQWNLTLGDDVVVQSWLSDSSVAEITARGHKVLAGNYNFWYLDCGHGQWLTFTPSSYSTYYPFPDYCSPLKPWSLIYSYDPLSSIPPSSQHLVLGGEVHMWSEQTDDVSLDSTVWPRASAAGEVLWSGRKDGEGRNRTLEGAVGRLAEMRERMVARGVGAGVVQMVFCTESEPGVCAL